MLRKLSDGADHLLDAVDLHDEGLGAGEEEGGGEAAGGAQAEDVHLPEQVVAVPADVDEPGLGGGVVHAAAGVQEDTLPLRFHFHLFFPLGWPTCYHIGWV